MMQRLLGALTVILGVGLSHLASAAEAPSPSAIDDRYAEVNGVKLHYLVAGTGNPVILLHGYADHAAR